jgi:glutaconate CoA-transferase subunit A
MPDTHDTHDPTGAPAVAPQRLSKEISLEEAGRIIAASTSVAITGSQAVDVPMALIRAAIRAGARDLTVVPPVSTSFGPELFIAADAVSTLYVCYIGFETQGFAPMFRKAAEGRTIEIVEADEPFIVLGARAAASGVPFIPVYRTYEGTDLLKLNPRLKSVTDPFTGAELTAIPPLRTDICLIHASEVDEFGNARVVGTNKQELDKARAADIVIVSAERLVSVDRTKQDPRGITIPGHVVTHVVHAPYGAHPMGSGRDYHPDDAHLAEYFEMAESGRISEYLAKYVYDVDHTGYLEAIGFANLIPLQRGA